MHCCGQAPATRTAAGLVSLQHAEHYAAAAVHLPCVSPASCCQAVAAASTANGSCWRSGGVLVHDHADQALQPAHLLSQLLVGLPRLEHLAPPDHLALRTLRQRHLGRNQLLRAAANSSSNGNQDVLQMSKPNSSARGSARRQAACRRAAAVRVHALTWQGRDATK